MNSNYFDAINFWKDDFSPFQKTVKSFIEKDNCRVVNMLTTPQVGKSYLAYRDLFLRIFEGWQELDMNNNRMRNKVFFIVIPLEKDIRKFLTQQLIKGFGVNKAGLFATDIEKVRIPICLGLDEEGKPRIKMQKIVKNKHSTNELSFTFFNDCKLLCFSSSNASQHLNGYTFKHGVYDEYSKFSGNITHIASARLLHENGTLLTVTTLNEDDPANWYYYEIIKPFIANSKLISERNVPIWTGLDIYEKKVDREEEINIGDNIFKKIHIQEANYLCVGSFENVYPYIHNSETVYKGVQAMRETGEITEQSYRNLFCCDISVDENRFLSNYKPNINNICLDEIEDLDNFFTIQGIGYDHGTGKTDKHSGIGWSRVGAIWDMNNPSFEQYVVIDSGIFTGEYASIDYVAQFFSKFPYWIFYDPSLAWEQALGKKKINWFFQDYPRLLRRMKPASMNLKNDSRERIAFWQKALSVSLNPKTAEKKAIRMGEPFNIEEYIEYRNPLDKTKLGCQIYLAESKNRPQLNERLIWEIQNYRKVIKNGKVQEEARAKVDTWDATSYAILGLKQWRSRIEGKPNPAVLVNKSKQIYKQKIYQTNLPLRQNFTQIQSFHINNNFSNF